MRHKSVEALVGALLVAVLVVVCLSLLDPHLPGAPPESCSHPIMIAIAIRVLTVLLLMTVVAVYLHHLTNTKYILLTIHI